MNYRPISNLTYISKLVERMVNQQVVAYLDENKLLPKLQSGFRARHSTETALLKVLADIFLSADQQQVTLLVLLDMSAQHLIPSITPYCFKDWSLPSECPVSFCLGCRPSSMAVPSESIYSIPRLRSSLSGPAYRREASSDLCCSFSLQQIFP